jgi:hypothetical protein
MGNFNEMFVDVKHPLSKLVSECEPSALLGLIEATSNAGNGVTASRAGGVAGVSSNYLPTPIYGQVIRLLTASVSDGLST